MYQITGMYDTPPGSKLSAKMPFDEYQTDGGCYFGFLQSVVTAPWIKGLF